MWTDLRRFGPPQPSSFAQLRTALHLYSLACNLYTFTSATCQRLCSKQRRKD